MKLVYRRTQDGAPCPKTAEQLLEKYQPVLVLSENTHAGILVYETLHGFETLHVVGSGEVAYLVEKFHEIKE